MVETSSNQQHSISSGRRLIRNTIWNLLGSGAPLAVAIFSIPILIRNLGKERFGVLALAWALIGYASVFDLGLGRALTQLVAKKLGAGERSDVPSLAWTSLSLMLMLGVAGAGAVIWISPWLVRYALHVPEVRQMLQSIEATGSEGERDDKELIVMLTRVTQAGSPERWLAVSCGGSMIPANEFIQCRFLAFRQPARASCAPPD